MFASREKNNPYEGFTIHVWEAIHLFRVSKERSELPLEEETAAPAQTSC